MRAASRLLTGAAVVIVSGLLVSTSVTATAAPVTTPARMSEMCLKIKGQQIKVKKCKTLETDVPGKPQRVRAKVTGPQAITVRWKEPSSGNVPTSYTVVAVGNGATSLVCTSKKRTCTAENLVVDQEYTFYVVGANASGSGAAGVSEPILLPAEASPDGFR